MNADGEHPYKDGIDYRYFAFSDTEFAQKSRSMANFKLVQVSRFLAVLEIEQGLEKERFGAALDQLKKDGIELPDMEEIKSSFLKEIKLLDNYIRLAKSASEAKEIILTEKERYADIWQP